MLKRIFEMISDAIMYLVNKTACYGMSDDDQARMRGETVTPKGLYPEPEEDTIKTDK